MVAQYPKYVHHIGTVQREIYPFFVIYYYSGII